MRYVYEAERSKIFTEEGQRMFLAIRDRTQRLLKEAGACRVQEMITGVLGGSWTMLACVDRMVELGEIRELTPPETPGQFRVFVSRRS